MVSKQYEVHNVLELFDSVCFVNILRIDKFTYSAVFFTSTAIHLMIMEKVVHYLSYFAPAAANNNCHHGTPPDNNLYFMKRNRSIVIAY